MPDVRLFTSESVSEGHPDKLADQISDAILDECLKGDPESRTAIETLLAKGFALVTGEVRTECYVEISDVVRDTIQAVGYTDPILGLDGQTCGVLVSIQPQSEQISQGVDTGGAGDQGMMFGMACDETPELMPLPMSIAHALMRLQADIKRTKPHLGFRPDAKSQVTVAYENGRPKFVHTVVCSCQQDPSVKPDEFRERVIDNIIRPVLQKYADLVDIERDITFHVNPTGAFSIGGPEADAGLTGRKIMVDSYGGFCPHGGGAYSGKDPTKVDRSAAYMARHAAKCIVAAGLARRAQLNLAYAIGIAEPIQVTVDTFGTETIPSEEIEARVRAEFPFNPRGIADYLGLRSPGMKYLPTAKNGHFGNPAFPWESTEAAGRLK
ncbi:MAG: methionine adenosyltransferase [Armatimonadetes bacterium]|nr:methionine adenosyltransferase [Armatimonadota bacterium]